MSARAKPICSFIAKFAFLSSPVLQIPGLIQFMTTPVLDTGANSDSWRKANSDSIFDLG